MSGAPYKLPCQACGTWFDAWTPSRTTCYGCNMKALEEKAGQAAPFATCAVCGRRRCTDFDQQDDAHDEEEARRTEAFFGPNPFSHDPAFRVYKRTELCVACWREQEGLDDQ